MHLLEAPNLDLLLGLEPLSGISRDELEKITNLMERQVYAPGETLIYEATEATQFFILIQGKLDVVKNMEDGQVELLNVIERSGELFGEMALVEDKPRSAGIIARDESEVLVIHKDGFLGLVNHFPQFTLEVAKSISNYLRRTDITLIGTLEAKNRSLEATIQELNETRQELVKNERLSIIGRMASTILHDLKNPMTTISGFAQLIGLRDLPREEVIKYTELIGVQVSQFNALAQELLAFARGGASLNLLRRTYPRCFEKILNTVQFNLAQRNMQLEVDLQGEAFLNIDLDRFARVIENLAKNAVDAMEAGGVLKVSGYVAENQLKLTVTDNGCGMEADVQFKVFDAFFSRHKEGGTGLGLAIVRSIVEDHQGTITCASTLGEGTSFSISIPIITP